MMGLMLLGNGGGGDVVTLLGRTQFNSVPSGTATAAYYLTSLGKEQYMDGSGTIITLGDWVTPTSNAANYECRMTMTGGTSFSSGDSVGVWIALSTGRSWTVTRSTFGSKHATATIEIRDTATSTVRASAFVDLTADHG